VLLRCRLEVQLMRRRRLRVRRMERVLTGAAYEPEEPEETYREAEGAHTYKEEETYRWSVC
jgi:hypothetical protein